MTGSEDLRGKSLFEIEELDIARKKTKAARENARQEKRIFIDHKMSDTQKRAKKETKDARDPDASKAEQTSGIRDNMAQEKEAQRVVEAFDLSNDGTKAAHEASQETRAIPSSSKSSRDLELLKEKRKQREGGIK